MRVLYRVRREFIDSLLLLTLEHVCAKCYITLAIFSSEINRCLDPCFQEFATIE